MTGMTVTGRLELVALDATDIVGLASFYAELTGKMSVPPSPSTTASMPRHWIGVCTRAEKSATATPADVRMSTRRVDDQKGLLARFAQCEEYYRGFMSWDILVPAAVTLAATAIGFGLALRQEQVRFAREQRAGLYIDLLAAVRLDVQQVWLEVNDPAPGQEYERRAMSEAEHKLRARVDVFGSVPVRVSYEHFTFLRDQPYRDLQEREYQLKELAAAAGCLRALLRAEVGIDRRWWNPIRRQRSRALVIGEDPRESSTE